MSEELYMPDLEQAVEKLKGLDEYRVVLEFIRQGREGFISELRQAETPHDSMKLAGSIAALQELLETLS